MPSPGIIGAGRISRAVASALARRGITAMLASRRSPDSLRETVVALDPSIAARRCRPSTS